MTDIEHSRKKVLFVSVHPDDETLGCGGTILKHRDVGCEIFWLNLSGATIEHPYGFTQDVLDIREQLIKDVAARYGFNEYHNLALPTQMLDTLNTRDIVGAIDLKISEWMPEVIYLPNRSDAHSDHRVAFNALYACTKNFRKPYIRKILMYETLSETEFAPAFAENAFVPNCFMDITEYMDKKIEIMQMYDTEIMPDPYPRSVHAIKGLAAYRGSRIGVPYAEAFMLILHICQ